MTTILEVGGAWLALACIVALLVGAMIEFGDFDLLGDGETPDLDEEWARMQLGYGDPHSDHVERMGSA